MDVSLLRCRLTGEERKEKRERENVWREGGICVWSLASAVAWQRGQHGSMEFHGGGERDGRDGKVGLMGEGSCWVLWSRWAWMC